MCVSLAICRTGRLSAGMASGFAALALRGVEFWPMGLLRGFLAPFRGAIYVARERLWRHLVIPVVLDLALGAGTMVAAARFWRHELAEMLPQSAVLQWIFIALMTVIGGVILFILLQPLLSAVFCDRLSETVEKRIRGSVPTVPLLKSIGKALAHGLLKLALYALAFGVALALTATPLLGFGTLLGVALGAIFLAYDGFDYPLARRNASFGAKWVYLAKHPGLTLGYGLGTYVLYLVPLAFLVAPPFAAVGATLAFLEVEDRAANRKARKPSGGSGKDVSAREGSEEAKAAGQVHNPIDISAS
jgi:CysZ protein